MLSLCLNSFYTPPAILVFSLSQQCYFNILTSIACIFKVNVVFLPQQTHLDMLLVNLQMEAVFLKETFNIKWVAQTGLVENIERIVKEYKQSRGLLVMAWCMLF